MFRLILKIKTELKIRRDGKEYIVNALKSGIFSKSETTIEEIIQHVNNLKPFVFPFLYRIIPPKKPVINTITGIKGSITRSGDSE